MSATAPWIEDQRAYSLPQNSPKLEQAYNNKSQKPRNLREGVSSGSGHNIQNAEGDREERKGRLPICSTFTVRAISGKTPTGKTAEKTTKQTSQGRENHNSLPSLVSMQDEKLFLLSFLFTAVLQSEVSISSPSSFG